MTHYCRRCDAVMEKEPCASCEGSGRRMRVLKCPSCAGEGARFARKSKKKNCTTCADGMAPNSELLWTDKDKMKAKREEQKRERAEAAARKKEEKARAELERRRKAYFDRFEEKRLDCPYCEGVGKRVFITHGGTYRTRVNPYMNKGRLYQDVTVPSTKRTETCDVCDGDGVVVAFVSKKTGKLASNPPPTEEPVAPALWPRPRSLPRRGRLEDLRRGLTSPTGGGTAESTRIRFANTSRKPAYTELIAQLKAKGVR